MDWRDADKVCTGSVQMQDLDEILAVASLDSGVTTCSEAVDVNLLQLEPSTQRSISRDQIKEAQLTDDIISIAYKFVLQRKKPTKVDKSGLSREAVVLLHQFSKLEVDDGILVRRLDNRTQIVLPYQFHQLVFRELHTKMGHLGPEKVEELARQRFYWPYMSRDIEHFIQKECPCIASKRPPVPEKAPLVPIQASAPFELVCIDFLHLDACQGGWNYVLLVTDHFTRFTQAYATKDNTSTSAAAKLFYDFALQFGFPKTIHHDRGEEFNSTLFQELHRLAGIRVSNTTPYHPMGNGEVEHLNRTLINMLKSLPEDQKKNWKIT